MLSLRVQFNLIIPNLSRDILGTGQLRPAGGLPLLGQSAALLSSRNVPARGLPPPFPAGSRLPPPPLSFSPCLGFLTLPYTGPPPPPRPRRPSGGQRPQRSPSRQSPAGTEAPSGTLVLLPGNPGCAASACPSGRCLWGRRWSPPPCWVRAPIQSHGPSSRHPPGDKRRRAGTGAMELRWDKSPGAGIEGREALPTLPLRERARGALTLGRPLVAPAAPSDLLRAAKGSSPAAERGKPRASPVSSGCCCGCCCCRRSGSLRFPTDGLSGCRLTPRSSRAPSHSPAGDFSPRFL